jgi:hypothetical protein
VIPLDVFFVKSITMKANVIVILFMSLCVESAWPQQDVIYPGKVSGASFIYLPQYKQLALIGGGTPPNGDLVKSDVWLWGGTKWTRIAASGPGSRDFFPCAFDASGGNTFCFAGMDAREQRMGDLWKFTGEHWEKVATNFPGTKDHHKMVYADHINALVVYGGQFAERTLDTVTWLVRDGKFTAMTIPGAGKRYHSGLAYDKHREKVILYGGGEKPGEHWEFDGKRWEQVRTTVNPGNRLYHFMVYDEKNRRTILHGGWRNQDYRDSTNHKTPLTWAFDGKEWKKIAEQDVYALAIGYDPVSGKVVVYGKKDLSKAPEMAIWELSGERWVLKASFGK